MSTPQYDLLRASITDADCLRAFDYLKAHIGYDHRVSIEDVAAHLYGKSSYLGPEGERVSTANNIRKARDVVELLRTEFGVAVCSSSGKAGRWLAESEAEKQECLRDFYNRRASIDSVIRALEKAKVPVPFEPRQRTQAVQSSLF